ncbi:Na(+)/H(+) exchanger beta-like isoform X2 [Lineus longissimus]|uniref:Na(+)/H(+) exchanger beta-like isoform X2 n=1 Tax=Lineus longissimus TaxID=88925 RepID=UPI002B4F2E55
MGSYGDVGFILINFIIGCISFVLTEASEVAISPKNGTDSIHNENESAVEEMRYHVAGINFDRVAVPFVISLWILLASLAKIGFHLYNKLSSIFPESCLLILIGVIVGILLFFSKFLSASYYQLDSTIFFLFLLPPIVLEAGYFMPNRSFFDNIGTILLYAIVGTLFNTLTIGFSLWAVSNEVLGWVDVDIGMLHCLLFASLISAVDPVAVLAVFEEIQVNEVLHIIVFGESLLNDAVTVVLYHMFESFSEIEVQSAVMPIDVIAGVGSFFVAGGVGTLIGVLFGFFTGLITKYTDHVRVIEPIFVFVMAYLAYLTAELFHLSGIMAAVFCGITMKQYVEANVTNKSQTTIKYFMKMLSSVSETIIFMFLGCSTVIDTHDFQVAFVGFTLIFCFVYRVLGVLILTWMANRVRLLKLTKTDQFVMAYGGLRGAIAFSLCKLLNENHVPMKRMLVTTTIVVVYFTVFIQGITIKPLVDALHVKKSDKHECTMNEQINERFMDHIMAGIEDISGHHGHHYLRGRFELLNTKYLKPALLREKPKTRETSIFRTFTRLNLKDAVDYVKRHGSISNSTSDIHTHSLSHMIRRASVGSMQTLVPNGEVEAVDGASNFEEHRNDTILDMRSIDPKYSKKMADDSKMHHLLEDDMFKPRKQWTKHRRHSLDDVVNHPPFHHNLRLHLRHLVSSKKVKEEKKRRESKAQNLENAIACGRTVRNVSFNIEALPGMEKDDAEAKEKEKEEMVVGSSNSDNESDDMGIIFTARTTDPQIEIYHPPPVTNINEQTAVETSLPWKRETNRPPMSSSFTHSMPKDGEAKLSECPSWVDNLDYSGNINGGFNDNDKFNEENNKDSVDSPLPFPWRTVPTEDPPVSSLPWRNENGTESEPVISPTASQVWSTRLATSDLPSTDNSVSKHSEPIIMQHVMDLPYLRTNGSLSDMHHVPSQNLLFDHGSNDGDEENEHFRRRPSFFRNRSIDRGRRPSIQLPLDTGDDADRLERIRTWLRSSHPDNLASPPADIFNTIDMPPHSDIAGHVDIAGMVNTSDMETML